MKQDSKVPECSLEGGASRLWERNLLEMSSRNIFKGLIGAEEGDLVGKVQAFAVLGDRSV